MTSRGTTASTNQAMPLATASRVSPLKSDACAGAVANSAPPASARRRLGDAGERAKQSLRKMNLRTIEEAAGAVRSIV